jgi:hypothetical protein
LQNSVGSVKSRYLNVFEHFRRVSWAALELGVGGSRPSLSIFFLSFYATDTILAMERGVCTLKLLLQRGIKNTYDITGQTSSTKHGSERLLR